MGFSVVEQTRARHRQKGGDADVVSGSGKKSRSSNGSRRRAIIKRVKAAYDTCALCGKPVDTSLPAGHPMSPEVDEIVPFSLGGSATDWSNVQLAHRICNQRKGNRMAGAPPRTVSAPLPHSRQW
jgi:5-methylcytosine-specific restriction endonuclease McrA